MENQVVPNQSKKALYLFLCAVLGIIMFSFIQQSFWIIYVDLAAAGYLPQLNALNPLPLVTLLAAFLLGMWYGIWLGLYWYEIVYERGGARWFYAFSGRGKKTAPASAERLPWEKPGTSSRADSSRWRLDDLLNDTSKLVPEPEPEVDRPAASSPAPVITSTKKRTSKTPVKPA